MENTNFDVDRPKSEQNIFVKILKKIFKVLFFAFITAISLIILSILYLYLSTSYKQFRFKEPPTLASSGSPVEVDDSFTGYSSSHLTSYDSFIDSNGICLSTGKKYTKKTLTISISGFWGSWVEICGKNFVIRSSDPSGRYPILTYGVFEKNKLINLFKK